MKNSFILRYAVHRWLLTLGAATGPVGFIATWFLTTILGDIADKAIIKIDLTLDQLKEAMRDDRWKDEALKYYDEASAKVYTEEEKNAIRKKYMDALAGYASFGNGVPVNQNSKH